jgi:hypothetical protein
VVLEAKSVQVGKGRSRNFYLSAKRAARFENQVKQVHGRGDLIQTIHTAGAVRDQRFSRSFLLPARPPRIGNLRCDEAGRPSFSATQGRRPGMGHFLDLKTTLGYQSSYRLLYPILKSNRAGILD